MTSSHIRNSADFTRADAGMNPTCASSNLQRWPPRGLLAKKGVVRQQGTPNKTIWGHKEKGGRAWKDISLGLGEICRVFGDVNYILCNEPRSRGQSLSLQLVAAKHTTLIHVAFTVAGADPIGYLQHHILFALMKVHSFPLS